MGVRFPPFALPQGLVAKGCIPRMRAFLFLAGCFVESTEGRFPYKTSESTTRLRVARL